MRSTRVLGHFDQEAGYSYQTATELLVTQPHTPQFGKHFGKKYLKWDLQDDEGGCQEGRPADLHIHQVGEHSQVDGADPQEVQEHEGLGGSQC